MNYLFNDSPQCKQKLYKVRQSDSIRRPVYGPQVVHRCTISSDKDLIHCPHSFTEHAPYLSIWKGKRDSCGWSPLIKAPTHRFHDIQMSLSVGDWWLRTCPEGDSEILMDQLIQWAISSGVEGKDSIRSYQNVSRCVPGKGARDSSTKRHRSKGFSLYRPFTAPVYIVTCIDGNMASVYTFKEAESL